jgi:hypothetical protein
MQFYVFQVHIDEEVIELLSSAFQSKVVSFPGDIMLYEFTNWNVTK